MWENSLIWRYDDQVNLIIIGKLSWGGTCTSGKINSPIDLKSDMAKEVEHVNFKFIPGGPVKVIIKYINHKIWLH